MGLENEDFIDFPFKQEYVDEDEILYFSGDEIEGPISPHNFDVLPMQLDDWIFTVDADTFNSEDDDDEYVPTSDGEDSFSDSDIFCETSDYNSQSGVEQAYFSDSNEDSDVAESSDNSQDNNKESEENKTLAPKPQQAPTASNLPSNESDTSSNV